MCEPVNENQQVDLERLKKWVAEGQELLPQMEELLSLVENTDFLADVQKSREDQIVEQMASDAGLITPRKKDRDV